CMPSGLGPPECIIGAPTKQTDFLNACTTSKFAPFDNCDRIKLCNENTPLPPLTTPMTTQVTSSNPPAAPLNLCNENAPGGRVIWLFGSSDFGPMLRAAQPSLSALPIPYRAVFKGATSCAGVNSIFDATKSKMLDPPGEN